MARHWLAEPAFDFSAWGSRIRGSGAISDVRTMKLYHPTKHATGILRNGFGERSGTYLTETDHSGVWLFDRPVNAHQGDADPDVMLQLEIPETVVAPFEWEVGLPYRQFLMPAGLVNLFGPPRVRDEQEA